MNYKTNEKQKPVNDHFRNHFDEIFKKSKPVPPVPQSDVPTKKGSK